MKTNKKQEQGISLIVLVITIIVMIILAGAIILSLNNSSVIGRAEEAVIKSDVASLREKLQVILADNKLNAIEDITAEQEEELLSGTTEYGIYENDIVYIGNDTEKQNTAMDSGIQVITSYEFIKNIDKKLLYINGCITGLQLDGNENRNTKVDVLNLLTKNGTVNLNAKILSNTGTELSDEDIVSTGCQVYNGDVLVGRIVVYGDVDKNNDVDAHDVTTILSLVTNDDAINLLDPETISNSEYYIYRAADVNHDNIVNSEDVTMLLRFTSGVISTIEQRK